MLTDGFSLEFLLFTRSLRRENAQIRHKDLSTQPPEEEAASPVLSGNEAGPERLGAREPP